MQNSSTIQIDLDKVLVTLFCCYAFSMPFELILEILVGIDTIFKPFRILSLVIIGVFGIKVLTQKLYVDKRDRVDWLLYGVFLYGIIISCFKIITGVFDFRLFLNDSFQFSLHVATFFIYKSTPITKEQALKIFKWFLIGVSLNAAYIYYRFVLNWSSGRQAGFTDNPNYAAFGLVAATTFLILKSNFKQFRTNILLTSFLILFLLYTFGIEGSRTGFIMFLVANILIFFFSSIRRKISILLVSGLILLLLIPGQIQNSAIKGPMVLINRLNKSIEGDEDVRFVVWRGIFRVLESEGYEGLGIGQFKANFPKYYSEESNKLILEMTNYGYFLSPHNDYLAILVDYGLPSLLFYIAFLVASFWKLFQNVNHQKIDDDGELLAQFCFIFFCCIIIFGMAAENFQHQLYWFLLMFTTKQYLK